MVPEGAVLPDVDAPLDMEPVGVVVVVSLGAVVLIEPDVGAVAAESAALPVGAVVVVVVDVEVSAAVSAFFAQPDNAKLTAATAAPVTNRLLRQDVEVMKSSSGKLNVGRRNGATG